MSHLDSYCIWMTVEIFCEVKASPRCTELSLLGAAVCFLSVKYHQHNTFRAQGHSRKAPC